MFLCFPEASGRGICHRLTIWLDLLVKERRMNVSVLNNTRFRSDTFRWRFVSSLWRVVQIYEVRLSHEPSRVRLLLAALITLPSLCFHSVKLIQVVTVCQKNTCSYFTCAAVSSDQAFWKKQGLWNRYSWLINLTWWPAFDWNSWYIMCTCVHVISGIYYCTR